MNLVRRARLWRSPFALHPPVAVVVRADPAECVQTLIDAARPSTQRLHLRNVFMDGRRYYIQPRPAGFRITSDTRVFWGSRRRRTGVAAAVFGAVSTLEGDESITAIRLTARIHAPYIVSSLLIPAFIGSIIVYMPWDAAVRAALIAALFALSWFGHWVDAALQVNEMIYFVRKALEHLPPAEVGSLAASVPHVVNKPREDFRAEWQKFYDEQIGR
jgi:hypothetical protein